MSGPRYLWRKLTPQQKQELLTWRKRHSRPWHSPPHRPHHNRRHFLISAACYEHTHHIGFSPQRMDTFTSDLLKTLSENNTAVRAWCVLPNHYHTLVATPDLGHLL